MMTAESTLSKRAVLRFTVALLFLLMLFSSHIYCTNLSGYKSELCLKIVKMREVVSNNMVK